MAIWWGWLILDASDCQRVPKLYIIELASSIITAESAHLLPRLALDESLELEEGF
jgi:hypothetical protein